VRSFAALLETELEALAGADRLRRCPELAGSSRVRVAVGAESRVSFCSNDYLGLANHPALAAAAAAASARDGFGASAARLVSGDLPAHRELESELAGFLGRQAALVFPTGYQTNIGVLTALAGPDDVIVSDSLNHASIVDGCRLPPR
jgi:7-keto-8-aminopelargonate synthetase-like enzyme